MTVNPFTPTERRLGMQYDETRQKPGWYVARILNVVGRHSSAGNPMPTVEFEDLDNGYLYPLWCPLPPETARGFANDLEKFNQVLRACDMPAMTRDEIINEVNVSRIQGCMVAIRLDSEYWAKKSAWRSVIKEVRSLSNFKVKVSLADPIKDETL